MNSEDSTVIAKLRYPVSGLVDSDLVYNVEAWRIYGVVAPGFCTTNGSAAFLVRCLGLWRDDGQPSYIWESCHPLVPSMPTDPVTMYDGLVAAFQDLYPRELWWDDESEKAYHACREAVRVALRKQFKMESP